MEFTPDERRLAGLYRRGTSPTAVAERRRWHVRFSSRRGWRRRSGARASAPSKRKLRHILKCSEVKVMGVTKRKPNTSPLTSDNPELLLEMFRRVSFQMLRKDYDPLFTRWLAPRPAAMPNYADGLG